MKEQHQRQLGPIVIWVFIFGFLFHLLLLFFYRDLLFYEYFPTETIFPKIEILSKLRNGLDVKKYSNFMFNNTILFYFTTFLAAIIPIFRFRRLMSLSNIRSNKIPANAFFAVLVFFFFAFINFLGNIHFVRKHKGKRESAGLIDFNSINIENFLIKDILFRNAFCSIFMSVVLIIIIASFLENKVFFNSFRKTKS